MESAADTADHELIRQTKRSLEVGRVVLWSMMSLTLFGVVLLTVLIFRQPPAAQFLRANAETPLVIPDGKPLYARGQGSVRMRAYIESPLDPACLVSTQYFIVFSDRSVAKLPGLRITTQGEVKESVYETAVPLGSPKGPAGFFVRDSYNCGMQARRVESPVSQFVIGPIP